MTADQQPVTPSSDEGEVAPVVAVGRTLLGVVLVLVGLVLGIAGAIWYFVVPWFGWARTDIWYDLSEWADLGGAVVGIGGFVILIVGAALIQRARKKSSRSSWMSRPSSLRMTTAAPRLPRRPRPRRSCDGSPTTKALHRWRERSGPSVHPPGLEPGTH
ncbi:hypothetical protein [Schumannella luteola]